MQPPAVPVRPARILPVIVLSQLSGISLWFAGNAVLPVKSVDAEVVSGQTTDAVIPLRPAGVVVGRVVDAESGHGIARVKIDIHEAPDATPSGYRGGRLRSDDDGRFHIHDERTLRIQIDHAHARIVLNTMVDSNLDKVVRS